MLQKRLLVSAFFFCCFFMSHAQFQKGMRMAGVSIGTVSYNSGKADYTYPSPTIGYTRNTNDFGLSLSPNYGWFITPNTVIGASLNVAYKHSKIFDEDAGNGNTFNKDESNSFSIGVGGFARNYFSTSGKFYPFAQFGFNFGIGSADQKGFYFKGSDKYTYNGKASGSFFANTGLALGLTKLLNKHTGLDFSIGYNFSYSKNSFKTTTLIDLTNNGTVDQTNISEPTQKFTNHGVSFSVGFQIFLEGKK